MFHRHSQESLNFEKMPSLTSSNVVSLPSTKYMRISTSVMSLKGSARRQRFLKSNNFMKNPHQSGKEGLKKISKKVRQRFNEETLSNFAKASKLKQNLEVIKNRER